MLTKLAAPRRNAPRTAFHYACRSHARVPLAAPLCAPFQLVVSRPGVWCVIWCHPLKRLLATCARLRGPLGAAAARNSRPTSAPPPRRAQRATHGKGAWSPTAAPQLRRVVACQSFAAVGRRFATNGDAPVPRRRNPAAKRGCGAAHRVSSSAPQARGRVGCARVRVWGTESASAGLAVEWERGTSRRARARAGEREREGGSNTRIAHNS